MKSIFALIVLFSFYNSLLCIEYNDCGSSDGKVTSVSVSDCPPSDSVCALKSGTKASIDVQFTSNVDSSSNTVKVWGVINGLAIPFAMNPNDACKWGLNCPVSKGSNQSLKIAMPVSAVYPKIQFMVRVAVVDSNGANLMCTQFRAKIV